MTIVLALFGFVANAQPKGLLGTWKAATLEIFSDGEVLASMNCSDAGMSMKFIFKHNGVAYGEVDMEGDKESEPLTYKVSGSQILVTDEAGETVPFTYSEGKLYMKMQEDGMDIRVNFKKQQ